MNVQPARFVSPAVDITIQLGQPINVQDPTGADRKTLRDATEWAWLDTEPVPT